MTDVLLFEKFSTKESRIDSVDSVPPTVSIPGSQDTGPDDVL